MNPDMTPIDWAKRPLQKYADFSDRAPRAEYWWYALAVVLTAIVATIIDSMLGFGTADMPYGPVYILLMLALLIPGIAVTVRRLHDTDRSGWWVLIVLIPLIGAIVLLVFMLLPSTPGANRFGPNLYGEAGPATA